MAKWIVKESDINLKLMVEVLGIDETLATVISNRGMRSKKVCLKYLNPDLAYLNDIFEMYDLKRAFDVIINAVSDNQKIAIYGDYDVDGVVSTTILYKSLKYYGADVVFYIPDRMSEGYGLNKNAIQMLKDENVSLIITCDNGIASLEETEFAKFLDMQVIIIDHHEPGFVSDDDDNQIDVLPAADAIVNPKQKRCKYPFKALCAGGICYKFVVAFFRYCDLEFPYADEMLVLSMISTFCDVVDLVDENRIIAKNGLDLLNRNKKINIGLFSLINEKSLTEQTLESFHIGFILGPCINACGRLEKAQLAVELLVSEDQNSAAEIAKKLSELNDERKSMTKKSVDEVIEYLSNNDKATSDSILVIYNAGIHESIAGIVAGRIKDMFHKPTIVLTDAEGCVKGSARSIEAYNIFLGLFECRELFLRFGGHKMAAGLSLVEENMDALRVRLNTNCNLTDDDFVEIITIDKELQLEDVTYELAKSLKALEPFGKENKEPLFSTKGLTLSSLKVIEEKDTIIFTFSTSETFRKVKGICFGKVGLLRESLSELYDEYDVNKVMNGILRSANFTVDVVYHVGINEFNNNVSVQMKIRDFRLCL